MLRYDEAKRRTPIWQRVASVPDFTVPRQTFYRPTFDHPGPFPLTPIARRLAWLEPGDDFPPVHAAWRTGDPAPGLLAAGGALDVPSLVRAYRQGIFPWFSEGQPVLWWSPDPRMVLQTENFRLHRSLRKTVARFARDGACEIRIDSAFDDVIAACAGKERDGQQGTWILPEMVRAYRDMHAAGHAHSVETFVAGQLVGGLYCINMGGAVFGESMFSHQTDASKIALAALVALCSAQGIGMIDCQQNTAHLATLGAAEIPRGDFVARVLREVERPPPSWRFDSLYWKHLLGTSPTSTA
jgi:leucyl/phenylalanyl-tRNA---protein transferase